MEERLRRRETAVVGQVQHAQGALFDGLRRTGGCYLGMMLEESVRARRRHGRRATAILALVMTTASPAAGARVIDLVCTHSAGPGSPTGSHHVRIDDEKKRAWVNGKPAWNGRYPVAVIDDITIRVTDAKRDQAGRIVMVETVTINRVSGEAVWATQAFAGKGGEPSQEKYRCEAVNGRKF